MSTIKSYTDLQQSKKLAEILPLKSADMHWKLGVIDTIVIDDNGDFRKYRSIPAWSLAALLDILSKWAECVNEAGIAELSYEKVTKWCVSMLNCGKIKDCYADNPVDACYEMILKLHELNLL